MNLERRLVFAILLMIAVAVVPSLIIKSPRRPMAPADTTLARAATPDTARLPSLPRAQQAARPAPAREPAALAAR